MNRRQRLVLLLGGFLLAGNFLFPYTSFPVVREEPGRLAMTHEHGFIPIWQTLSAQRGEPLSGHPSGYPAVQWHSAIRVGMVIVAATSLFFVLLGRKRNSPQSLAEASKHA